MFLRFFFFLTLIALFLPGISAHAGDTYYHSQVLVFIPGEGGSLLFDPDLANMGEPEACVWGSAEALRDAQLYLALRLPNPLIARPLLSSAGTDLYGHFVSSLGDDHSSVPGFLPYTLGADFFIFAYDWRQEIGSVTVPSLAQALLDDAKIHEAKTGIPAAQTRFVLVAHSQGGLVARSLLNEQPFWADRISALYLVGTPSRGAVSAIKDLTIGPGGLKENVSGFATLLKLLPSNVDDETSKLVSITETSLYELLPVDDPRWECVDEDGHRIRIGPDDIFSVGSWKTYWPSAQLEKKVYLNGWLTRLKSQGKKLDLNFGDCSYCQDDTFHALQVTLAAAKHWRSRLGSLHDTSVLLTRPDEPSRLHLIVGGGIQTPTGIITQGATDDCNARYTYAPDNEGDDTVTLSSALDDITNPSQIKLLSKIPHAKLMNDGAFLDYLYHELSREAVVRKKS